MRKYYLYIFVVVCIFISVCLNIKEIKNDSKIEVDSIKQVVNVYKDKIDFKNFLMEPGKINYVKTDIGGPEGNKTKAAYKVEVINISKNKKLVIFITDYGVSVKSKNNLEDAMIYRIFEIDGDKVKLINEKNNEYILNLVR